MAPKRTCMAQLSTAFNSLLVAVMTLLTPSRINSPLAQGKQVPKQTPSGNKVPATVHATIIPERLKPGRIIVVGDVHGCNRELEGLLEQLKFQPDIDNVIFVGDLVNKGPASIEVLDTFLRLGAWSVRGNHDDSSLNRWHLWSSTRKNLKEQHEWVARMEPRHASILEDLPFTLTLPSHGIVIVHAGLLPSTSLELQDLWAMYKMRSLAPALTAGQGTAGSRWMALEKAKEGGKPCGSLWTGPYHMFFGHDAKRELQLLPFATGLDTGCVYGKQLTAAVIPPLQLLLDGASGSGQLRQKLALGLPVTREDLGVEIVAFKSLEGPSKLED